MRLHCDFSEFCSTAALAFEAVRGLRRERLEIHAGVVVAAEAGLAGPHVRPVLPRALVGEAADDLHARRKK